MNRWTLTLCSLATALLLAGCQSDKRACAPAPGNASSGFKAEPVAVIVPVVPVAAATGVGLSTAGKSVIRINAGSSSPFTDASGNVWLAEQGFEGGDVIDRPDLEIANTKSPELYRSEHYAMESFSWIIPKGRYQVKLHFAETFEGITGPGERVFSFNVEGQEFKDFDIWKKAGGGQRAYVETVNVEVQDGKLDIKFTSNIENPAINGIEIIPVL